MKYVKTVLLLLSFSGPVSWANEMTKLEGAALSIGLFSSTAAVATSSFNIQNRVDDVNEGRFENRFVGDDLRVRERQGQIGGWHRIRDAADLDLVRADEARARANGTFQGIERYPRKQRIANRIFGVAAVGSVITALLPDGGSEVSASENLRDQLNIEPVHTTE